MSNNFPVGIADLIEYESAAQQRTIAERAQRSAATVEIGFKNDGGESIVIDIATAEHGLGNLAGADDVVIGQTSIQIAYSYPLSTHGTSALESTLDCWLFGETAENKFTRADLAQRISARYRAIYEGERETSTIVPGMMPGTVNRNTTNGIYGIKAHTITDLGLAYVLYDPETGICRLGINS